MKTHVNRPKTSQERGLCRVALQIIKQKYTALERGKYMKSLKSIKFNKIALFGEFVWMGMKMKMNILCVDFGWFEETDFELNWVDMRTS